LKPSTNNGYKYVKICDNGVIKSMSVSRLILLVFVGENLEKPECDHIDRNKENNRLENLHWVTREENNRNRSVTRTDITETDSRSRKNIINKESMTKIRRKKGIKQKSVGCIYKTTSGKFRGQIKINKIKYVSKILPTRNEAQHFINQSVAFDWLKSLTKS